ncbi:2'-5' RNA ligase family protein [Clostridium tagluense]|nr:2'-5' RNA ligase family protein [Clostridium tagluense]
MKTRTIMIFPEFENIDVINDIRKKYDPLAELVLPHITLVFPFNSELTNEDLNLYLKDCLSDIQPFKVELEGFSMQEDKYGNYLFLNVVQGMNVVKNIHDILYKGKLKQFDMALCAITYKYEFKVLFIDEYMAGKLPRQIFAENGFDINVMITPQKACNYFQTYHL